MEENNEVINNEPEKKNKVGFIILMIILIIGIGACCFYLGMLLSNKEDSEDETTTAKSTISETQDHGTDSRPTSTSEDTTTITTTVTTTKPKEEKAYEVYDDSTPKKKSKKGKVVTYGDKDYELVISEDYDEDDEEYNNKVQSFKIHGVDVTKKADGIVLLEVIKAEYIMIVEWSNVYDSTCGPDFKKIQVFNYSGEELYSTYEEEAVSYNPTYMTYGYYKDKDELGISYNAFLSEPGGCENALEVESSFDGEGVDEESYDKSMCDKMANKKMANGYRRVVKFNKGKVVSSNIEVESYVNDEEGVADYCQKYHKVTIKK